MAKKEEEKKSEEDDGSFEHDSIPYGTKELITGILIGVVVGFFTAFWFFF